MARSLFNVEERISKIETETSDFFKEFQRFYRDYLKLLGQSVEQQLIFATHHLCTQIYPDAFLRLTFNQRQRLQEKFRQLAGKFENYLFEFLQNNAELLTEIPEINEDEENNLSEISGPDLNESKPKSALITINNPEDLLQWNQSVEHSIHETLEKLSKEANFLLQGAAILSNKIPPQVLEMAVQAEENSIGINRPGTPNILTLIIEAKSERLLSNDDDNEEDEDDDENDEIPENISITKISAIHLRLTEIEFNNPNLSHNRKQLRNFLEQLTKLGKQYRQLQREHLTVEAENAWRSSWTEK